jgi:hypothetical protein
MGMLAATTSLRLGLVSALLSLAMAGAACAEAPAPPRPVYVDAHGVIRWRATNDEVRLFGADYCAFSGADYRMAGLVGADHKALIDADMAHFARMGWDGMRLCSWGDWENSDGQGNLIENEHSDLMDYLVARAHARGISILYTPIHGYSPAFADQLNNPAYKPSGFSSLYPRKTLGLDPKAIAAETNYIGQVLRHVNPYTKLPLKDDPAIVFVEMINEPVHNPENLAQAVGYINALVDAVHGAGSRQITFHNYSQDFRIADALAASKVDGVDFGWYPSGLVAGHTLQGNFLQAVDGYPDMLNPKIANKPRIVYEFDQADLNTGYLFPAMARTYRSVGAQFAAIFAYDMLDTAPYNLGWQTHFINLVHTPRQAVSGVIAAEAMRRLPRMKSYGAYPENTRFGDFSVDYETDSSLLNAEDAYMYAGDTSAAPRKVSALKRIVGFGSSPLVDYEGTGAYFLDKVRDGVWRLEVYPDELLVSDPFAQPQPDKVVSRLYFKPWPMTVRLPDLGALYTAAPLNTPADAQARRAQAGVFTVEPGVWLLSRSVEVDRTTLPAVINRVGLGEYHVNAPRTYPDLIQSLTRPELMAGAPADIRVHVASQTAPDKLSLFIRPTGTGFFRKVLPMTRLRGDDYGATIPAGELAPGDYEYIVSETRGDVSTTFPGALAGRPGVWPFAAGEVWRFRITTPGTPLEIFNPGRDIRMVSFMRPSEEDRTAVFRITAGESSGSSAFSLAIPELGAHTPPQYAASLYIGDKVSGRGAYAATADALEVRLRASGGARKTLDLFLIEKDGSSWRGRAVATGDWTTATIPLQSLQFAKSILIPSPFPALWDFWRKGPDARAKGEIRPGDIERLELRVYANTGETASDDAAGVEIESVRLDYAAAKKAAQVSALH